MIQETPANLGMFEMPSNHPGQWVSRWIILSFFNDLKCLPFPQFFKDIIEIGTKLKVNNSYGRDMYQFKGQNILRKLKSLTVFPIYWFQFYPYPSPSIISRLTKSGSSDLLCFNYLKRAIFPWIFPLWVKHLQSILDDTLANDLPINFDLLPDRNLELRESFHV